MIYPIFDETDEIQRFWRKPFAASTLGPEGCFYPLSLLKHLTFCPLCRDRFGYDSAMLDRM